MQRNVREQEADARPAIAKPLASIDGYDAIVLASPIWNVRAPMIMTHVHRAPRLLGEDRPPGHDARHERSRHHPSDYARSCRGARIGAGLAIRGEQAGSAGAEVDAWLRDAGLQGSR